MLHFEHDEIGYNYRISNVLAALGRGQLQTLAKRVARRRAINAEYRAGLEDLPGIHFMSQAAYGTPTSWLTCLTIDPTLFGASRDDVIEHLAGGGIEARPTLMPMHLQTPYAGSYVREGKVAGQIFEQGLCLPSGSAMSCGDVDRVVAAFLQVAPEMASERPA